MPTNNFAAASGEWNTAANWSLGTVPIATEDCTFTGLDGSAALTITTTAAVCKSADFSGAGAAFTLSGAPNLTISGSLTCKTGMTWSHSGMLYIANGAAGTLTSSGVNLSGVAALRCNGGALTLADTLACGTKQFYVYNTASLATGNNTITCGIFGDNDSATPLTLTLGSSTINCSNVSFAFSTLTVTANTAAINITSTGVLTANFGGKVWGGTITVLMSGGPAFELNGTNTFANFALSHTTNNIASLLTLGADQTVSGTFTITGSATISRPTIKSKTPGTQRTITAATVTITGAVDFQDIVGAGAGSWNLSAIASGNCGGNTGITFRTAANYYLDFGTADAIMTDNCWATSSGGGAGGTGVFPLPQDTIVVDNLSWDDTPNILTLTANHRIGKVDMSALTETDSVVPAGATHYGSFLITGAGSSVTGTGAMTFDSRVRSEATEALVINCTAALGANTITVTSYAGTVQLGANLTHTGTFTLTQGTLDLNGKILTTNIFSSSNSDTRVLQDVATGGKIVTNALTGTVFNMATVTGLTVSNAPAVDIGDSNNTQSADVTFAGGGKTFGNFKITKHAGAYACIIIGANTFGSFTLETPDATYQYSEVNFTAATTTVVTSFVAEGTATYLIYIHSVTAATHTISDSAGTNTVKYCSLVNSIATGGATFNSFTTDGNVDGGGNTGWVFTALGPAGIAKYLGVAIAGIAKINGIAKAAIKKISGVG